MPFQTQLAIRRKLRVVVTTYVFTIAEAIKEKRKRRIKTSAITRIAASLLCIGDAASCCSNVTPPAYLHRYCAYVHHSAHFKAPTSHPQTFHLHNNHTTHLVTLYAYTRIRVKGGRLTKKALRLKMSSVDSVHGISKCHFKPSLRLAVNANAASGHGARNFGGESTVSITSLLPGRMTL